MADGVALCSAPECVCSRVYTARLGAAALRPALARKKRA